MPANTSVRLFLVVSTTGPNATIGQLIFDNGSSTGTAQILATSEGRCVAVTVALTGGTVSFDPDSIYVWDAQGVTWLKIGDVGGVTGATRIIRYTINNSATQDSTSQIPTNARVVSTKLVIGTTYSGGATIAIGRAGTLNLLQDVGDNLPQSAAGDVFETEGDIAWGGSAGVVRTTVTGSPAAGAGTVLVVYSLPNN